MQIVLGSSRTLAAGQRIPFECAIDYSPNSLELFNEIRLAVKVQNETGQAQWSAATPGWRSSRTATIGCWSPSA